MMNTFSVKFDGNVNLSNTSENKKSRIGIEDAKELKSKFNFVL
jgi:hypothetical protein